MRQLVCLLLGAALIHHPLAISDVKEVRVRALVVEGLRVAEKQPLCLLERLRATERIIGAVAAEAEGTHATLCRAALGTHHLLCALVLRPRVRLHSGERPTVIGDGNGESRRGHFWQCKVLERVCVCPPSAHAASILLAHPPR